MATAEPQGSGWRKAAGLAVSLAGHAAIVFALLQVPRPPPVSEPAAVMVSLIEAPSPIPAPAPNPAPPALKPAPRAPAAAAKSQPAPVREARAAPAVQARPTVLAARDAAASRAELSEGQLASASTAETGGGGGGGRECNMIAWLQGQLRQDPDIQAAVAEAHRRGGSRARALQVWDGDWLRSTGEEGEGLAGIREAIMMEVAFAPAACRNDQVRGLVLISLSDAPGAPRLAIGGGVWRWPDLLQPSWRR